MYFFEDYDSEQLCQIYKKMASEAGYETTEDAMSYVQSYMKNKCVANDEKEIKIGFNVALHERQPIAEDEENFSNARMVRNFLETAIMNQSNRLYEIGDSGLNNYQMNEIVLDDVKCI